MGAFYVLIVRVVLTCFYHCITQRISLRAKSLSPTVLQSVQRALRIPFEFKVGGQRRRLTQQMLRLAPKRQTGAHDTRQVLQQRIPWVRHLRRLNTRQPNLLQRVVLRS